MHFTIDHARCTNVHPNIVQMHDEMENFESCNAFVAQHFFIMHLFKPYKRGLSLSRSVSYALASKIRCGEVSAAKIGRGEV
jgi:hypothetical protein